MTARGAFARSTAVASLAALALAGCATGGMKMSADDTVAARQRLMKNVGGNWTDIQNKAKANNIEAIAVNAEALSLHAQRIVAYFPEGSLTDKSKAKPEIWQKWGDFQAAAMNLETRAARLRDTALTKNADATQAIVKDFGREACGACHTPFRVPPRT